MSEIFDRSLAKGEVLHNYHIDYMNEEINYG